MPFKHRNPPEFMKQPLDRTGADDDFFHAPGGAALQLLQQPRARVVQRKAVAWLIRVHDQPPQAQTHRPRVRGQPLADQPRPAPLNGKQRPLPLRRLPQDVVDDAANRLGVAHASFIGSTRYVKFGWRITAGRSGPATSRLTSSSSNTLRTSSQNSGLKAMVVRSPRYVAGSSSLALPTSADSLDTISRSGSNSKTTACEAAVVIKLARRSAFMSASRLHVTVCLEGAGMTFSYWGNCPSISRVTIVTGPNRMMSWFSFSGARMASSSSSLWRSRPSSRMVFEDRN